MQDDVKAVAEMMRKMAMVVDTLNQKTSQFEKRQEQSVQALQQTLAGVRNDVDRLVQGAEQRITLVVRQALEAALAQVVVKFEQAVAALIAKMTQAGQALEQAIQSAIVRLRRHVGMSYASVAGAMLLVILGGGLLLWYQQHSYEGAQARTEAANVNADTAELYARVGVSSCGGQPCIKLDTKSPHWGSHGEYVLLKPSAKH